MKAILIILAMAMPITAQAECPKVLHLGKKLNAVALNAGASSLTFTIGPIESNCDVGWYDKIVYDVLFDYTAQAGAISLTVTGGANATDTDRQLTTCSVASGNCTINFGGVATTASLSADTKWIIPVGTSNARAIKSVFAHGGTPGATDKITVTVWLVKD